MLLLYLSAAFVGGIVAASLAQLPFLLWAWWLILPAGSFLIWRDSFLRRASLCALAFLLGAMRLTLALPQPNEHSLASLNDRGAVAMISAVVEPPDVRDRSTYLRVSVQRVQVEEDWQAFSGLALVEVPRETDVRYGDVIEIFGAPTTPFETEDFSYKDYLARQGIYSLVRADESVRVVARGGGNLFFVALYALRDRAFTTIKTTFPEPAASLLAGILLGMDSGIPRDLHDAFAATNTLHIVAISGFNITIIAGILSKFARRVFSASTSTFVVIGGLAVYTLLVGASPSVVRAAIMGSLAVLALHYHRQNDALNALGIAALGMCVINPYTLFDLGFQLSFLATLGLVLYTESLTKGFENLIARALAVSLRGSKATEAISDSHSSTLGATAAPQQGLPLSKGREEVGLETETQNPARAQQIVIVSLLSDSLIVTLAAQITTTPLILFTFHRLSIVGLITNLLILPAQPPVMILGGVATMAGIAFQPLGQILAWIAWAFLEWTIIIVQATANMPFAFIEIGRLDVVLIGLWYIILFGTSRTNLSGVRSHITLRPAFALGGALVACVLLWNTYATAPDGRTRVVFIDANSAATFVQTPGGNKVLIDGGGNPSSVLEAIGQRIPFWDRQIDLIVLTNADDAYLSGLVEVLARYDVKQIAQVNAPSKTSAAYLRWRNLIAQKRVPSIQAQSGLRMVLDRDVTLEFLHPPGDLGESRGAIAQLRAGNIAFLFAEGSGADDQLPLLKTNADIASSVLIAPRKIAPEFLDAVNPQFAIVFAGKSARDKPTADLLTNLSPATILQTNTRGTIEMIVDGQSISARTTR